MSYVFDRLSPLAPSQSQLSATERLALILRLRDASFLAEHLSTHLRDFTQCDQLILVLQKVLYGNLARQAAVAEDAAGGAANGGANLPACARGLRCVFGARICIHAHTLCQRSGNRMRSIH